MSLKLNNLNIKEMKFGGHKVIGGMLNGQNLFTFEGTPYMSFRINTSLTMNNNFTIPFVFDNYGNNLSNISILWGDGNQTVITDGNITSGLCTHQYGTTYGEFDIFIYSYDNKIPKINGFGTSGSSPLVYINNPILPMINADGSNASQLVFNDFFKNCSYLERVSENIFSLNTYATKFEGTFYGCSNLTEIYNSLFQNNINTTSFQECFYQCESLTTIPTNLFRYNTLVNNFERCFYGCSGISLIPEDLFKYITVNLVDLSGCFSEIGINSIPNNLFYNLGEKLYSVASIFENCSSLNVLNYNIFSNNINLIFLSRAFYGTSIVSIPSGFFDNNTAASDFSYCFSNCSLLETIPEYLFRITSYAAATDFNYCFSECPKLKLISNIFCDEETEIATRFLNKTIDFTGCFSRSSFSGTQGIAPQLWNYTYGAVTSSNCFSGNGNSGSSLSNYYIIPDAWGGPYAVNTMALTIDTSLGTVQNNFAFPFDEGTYSGLGTMIINWGDNTSTTISNGVISSSNRLHTYSSSGIYTITISDTNGKIPSLSFGNHSSEGHNSKLIRLDNTILTMLDINNSSNSITSSNGMFQRCSNLQSIYQEIFIHNTQIQYLSNSFRGCSNLRSIDSNLLKPLANCISMASIFASCSNINGIPTDLFRYNISLDDLRYSFQNCTGITSIPFNLFKYNTLLSQIGYAFGGTNITEIPRELFKYNNIEYAFDLFNGCVNLVNIPSDLFSYSTNLRNVSEAFAFCSNLESVPEFLFKNNLLLTYMSGCFMGCNKLVLNKNIFCDEETEIATRFTNFPDDDSYYLLDFSDMFSRSSYNGSSDIGECPQLWNYTMPAPEKMSLEKDDCFGGNGNSNNSIINYSLITISWGGHYYKNTMSFTIDTRLSDSSNKTFILPFKYGNYSDLGDITIEWGEHENTNITVGDDLRNSELVFNYPSNLYSSLSNYSGNKFIDCGSIFSMDTTYNHTSYDTEAIVDYNIDYNLGIDINVIGSNPDYRFDYPYYYYTSELGSSYNNCEKMYIGGYSSPINVSSINSLNPAYNYTKIKKAIDSTIITDGIINETVCTHEYSTPGIYTVIIKSDNGNIPRIEKSGFGFQSNYLITSLNDTLLHMIDENGEEIINFNSAFQNAAITKVSPALFYFNRNVNNCNYLFSQCSSLTSIISGTFNYLTNLINASNCFSNCTSLSSIPFSIFKSNDLLNDVSYCFRGCSSLTFIPSELFINNVNITNFSYCFYSCIGLDTIGSDLFYYSGFMDKIINFNNCFYNAGSSTNTITLPNLWDYSYYLVDSRKCFESFKGTPTNWSDVPVGWGGDNTFIKLNIDTTKGGINDSTFIIPFETGVYSRLRYITVEWGDEISTTFPQNITEALCTHNYSNPGAYTVTIKNSTNGYMPNFNFGNYSGINASKLKSIEGTLYKMSNNDDNIIYTETGDVIDVVNFDYMFSGCSNLKSVSSSLLILNEKDENNDIYPTAIRMFENSGIEALEDNFFTYGITDFNACFYNCTSLVKLPFMRNSNNYNSCFYGCSSLQDISSDLFQLRGQSIGENKKFNFCFANCTSLITIPVGLFSFMDEVGLDEFTGCFNGCSNLTTIPDNLFASANSISYSMCFEGCNKLKINQNIFGTSTTKFGSLEDGQTVDMSSMFSITSFNGAKGTAPQLWDYLYAPSNYNNLFIQSTSSTETKSGVTVLYNTDSSININGALTSQSDFESSSFNFNMAASKIYNVCLSYISGSITTSSTSIIRMQIINSSTGDLYYSKTFSSLSSLNQWEGLKFDSSISANCKIVIRLYMGTSYDNLIIKPRISEAKINCIECFSGHSLNSLTNYNDIPSYWK